MVATAALSVLYVSAAEGVGEVEAFFAAPGGDGNGREDGLVSVIDAAMRLAQPVGSGGSAPRGPVGSGGSAPRGPRPAGDWSADHALAVRNAVRRVETALRWRYTRHLREKALAACGVLVWCTAFD
jgi:hypothetical protein